MCPLKNRKSPRAKWWDYTNPAAYFVTICTKDRSPILGEIINGKMHHSHSGIIANILWYEIKNHFRNVELDEYVIMPNHVHGIIIIKPTMETDNMEGTGQNNIVVGTGQNNMVGTGQNNIVVGTGHALSLPPPPPNLSTIVGSYKSAVTKHCNRLGLPSGWQSRYHDVIIRTEIDYQRIKKYIITNPENWDTDELA